MKRIILSVITLLASLNQIEASYYDEYPNQPPHPNHSPIGYYDDDYQSDDFCEINYVKLGGSVVTVGKNSTFVPVVGFGRRCECPEMGIDYSASVGYARGIAGNERSVFIYTVPKIMAIRFVDPCSNFSFYWGGGGSWSGIVNNNKRQTFHGVFAEAVLGYELQRKGAVRTFIQLEASQGILAAYRKGAYPSPNLLLTFGIGF